MGFPCRVAEQIFKENSKYHELFMISRDLEEIWNVPTAYGTRGVEYFLPCFLDIKMEKSIRTLDSNL